MSKYVIDHRDRLQPVSTDDKENRLRFMVRSGGYVMAKRPGRHRPEVFTEKEWARLPLFEEPSGKSRVGTNSGHGHAWERPDGVHMRCGGPRVCAECAKDQALVRGATDA